MIKILKQKETAKDIENPERERVKTLLQDLYQEKQENLPIYREITELAENLRSLFERANDYFEKYWNKKRYRIFEEQFSGIDYKEIAMSWEDDDKGESKSAGDFKPVLNTLNRLVKIIEDKNDTSGAQDKTDIENLIKKIYETGQKLDEKVKEIWDVRENILKGLLNEPEFSKWRDGQFGRMWKESEKKIYDLGGEIYIKKEFATKEGVEERNLFLKFGENWYFESMINQLKEKYNFSKEELNEIKELKWSGEEKEKLKILTGKIEKYRAEAKVMKNQFLGIKETFEFDEYEAGFIEHAMTRAFVKKQYTNSGLTKVHKERVVQQIMDGTFYF